MKLYHIPSGEVIDTYPMCEDGIHYSINAKNQLFYFDNTGIHEKSPDDSLVFTFVDDVGFAYAAPNLESMELLLDNHEHSYLAVAKIENSLKVFKYFMDETITNHKKQVLEIWSFEERPVILATIAAFS